MILIVRVKFLLSLSSTVFLNLRAVNICLHIGVPPNIFTRLVCRELKKVENH